MIVEVVVLILVVLALVWVHRRTRVAAEEKMYARQVAVDKRLKAITHEAQRARVEATTMLTQAQHLNENAQLLQQRLDEVLRDPRIRRIMDGS